jgi:2-(1,2-epoxy-1,2-dihydrophenyl)acetyl-CoA isomerase
MSVESNQDLLARTADGVLTLTLNRPQALNALTDGLIEGLLDRIRHAGTDPATRAIVIAGAGRGFCAGGDVKRLAQDTRTFEQKLTHLRHFHELPLALAQCPKVTIAMVNGPAIGAGLGLALCCDLRIAGESARFGASFAKIGAASDFGVSWLLPRIVGAAKARELLLTAENIHADAAVALGLATRVVPDDQLLAITREWALRFANGPTLSYQYLKRNLAAAETLSLADSLDLEAVNQVAAVSSADHLEAARAFVEKRTPVFKGC